MVALRCVRVFERGLVSDLARVALCSLAQRRRRAAVAALLHRTTDL
jgi:hypothetical protein